MSEDQPELELTLSLSGGCPSLQDAVRHEKPELERDQDEYLQGQVERRALAHGTPDRLAESGRNSRKSRNPRQGPAGPMASGSPGPMGL